MDEKTKEKIRELSQSDVPINERRALYNQLGRRMKHAQGLKPGLIQKYTSCLGNSKERFNLLKEFLIDENLFETYMFFTAYEMLKGYTLDAFVYCNGIVQGPVSKLRPTL